MADDAVIGTCQDKAVAAAFARAINRHDLKRLHDVIEAVHRLAVAGLRNQENAGLQIGAGVEQGKGRLIAVEGHDTQRQVDRWSKQISWAAEVTAEERPIPELDEVQSWLADNVPEEHPHTLVHGDYKLDNVMFGTGTPPEIVAIFDWELAALGDPYTDLGWMLSFWFDEKDPDLPSSVGALYSSITMREGYPTRKELVERYEQATGTSFDDERFYRTLGVYKLIGLGEMFFRRYLEGNSDDPLYPKMRDGVPQLADRALRIIEGEEPL